MGIDISYLGLEEKTAFATRLAVAGDIPPDVVSYGCLPGRWPGVTVGANRNALLLHTVGERIITVDDDIICEVAAAPGHRSALSVKSGDVPLRRLFFPTRAAAFAAVPPAGLDLLGEHSRYLGLSPASLIAAAGPDAVGCTDPALLRRVLSGTGRIRITANGVAGDCGWDNPDFYLFADDANFAELSGSATSFATAQTSREIVQSVTQVTITKQGNPVSAMCIGLDNTSLLPPFAPAGRGEEIAFGAVLTACFNVYGAHLPLVVRHDPTKPRDFADQPPFRIGLGSWLPACIGRFDLGPAASPAARLDRLGHLLIDLAELSADAFDEFARIVMWESMSALIGRLEQRLASTAPPPSHWARAARAFMARARRAALDPIGDQYLGVGGREALQHQLGQYGKLLIWWPAMTEIAQDLRNRATPILNHCSGQRV
jgi:hypothetical protein